MKKLGREIGKRKESTIGKCGKSYIVMGIFRRTVLRYTGDVHLYGDREIDHLDEGSEIGDSRGWRRSREQRLTSQDCQEDRGTSARYDGV